MTDQLKDQPLIAVFPAGYIYDPAAHKNHYYEAGLLEKAGLGEFVRVYDKLGDLAYNKKEADRVGVVVFNIERFNILGTYEGLRSAVCVPASLRESSVILTTYSKTHNDALLDLYRPYGPCSLVPVGKEPFAGASALENAQYAKILGAAVRRCLPPAQRQMAATLHA